MPPTWSRLALSLAAVALLAGSFSPAAKGLLGHRRIANAITTTSYPAVGAIVSNASLGDDPQAPVTGDDMEVECTGTLIGCKTVLTAAHCVSTLDPLRYQLFFQNAGFFEVTEIDVHPDWTDFINLDADLAIFHLATEAQGIVPVALPTTDPSDSISESLNPSATIVGFGRTSSDGADDSGIKRYGTIALEPCLEDSDSDTPGDVLCSTFDPENPGDPGTNSGPVGAPPGDGGAPVLLSSNGEIELAGSTLSSFSPTSQNVYVNTYSYLDFISEKLGEDPTSNCGTGPEVGGELVSTVGVEAELEEGSNGESIDFDVADGAQELLFIVNGQSSPSSNPFGIQLFMRQGGDASSQDYDCASTDTAPFAACSIADPEGGAWNALVVPSDGGGSFQFTGTLVGAPADGLQKVQQETPTFEVPEGEVYLYYINSELGSSGTVERVPVSDASAVEQLVQIPVTQTAVFGISVDEARDRIFYTTKIGSPNSSTVWEASLKGEDPAPLYYVPQGSDPDPPHGFGPIEAIEGDEGDLAWLDVSADWLYLGTVSGSAATTIDISPQGYLIGNLYGLAIDFLNERALVSEWEHDQIFAVTPEGDITLWMDDASNPSLNHPASMAIDNVAGKVYWTQEDFLDGVWRSDLDGQNPEQLWDGYDAFGQGGIALDLQAGMVYWADTNGGRIQRGAMDGTGESETFLEFDNPYSPRGLAMAYIPEPGAVVGAVAVLATLALLRRKRGLSDAAYGLRPLPCMIGRIGSSKAH